MKGRAYARVRPALYQVQVYAVYLRRRGKFTFLMNESGTSAAAVEYGLHRLLGRDNVRVEKYPKKVLGS